MTADYSCPICGDTLPQFGGDADRDIREAHHAAEHVHQKLRPDTTYRDAILRVAVLIAAVIMIIAVLS